MTEYLTEQEQIQLLKNWLKRYGPTILLGFLLATLITAGWRYWQYYRAKTLLHASAVYDEMLAARAQNNSNETILQAEKLLSHYSSTPYAQMAAFMLARDAVLKKNYAEAIKQLNWVISHADNHAVQEIARLRQARILINDKKPQAALELLNKMKDKTFAGLKDEARGDAYLALDKKNDALSAYKLALDELPNAEVNRPVLQMKIDNLTPEQN